MMHSVQGLKQQYKTLAAAKAAQVLTLAGEMQRQSGKPVPDLSGHDYVKDAVREIKQKREDLIQMLLDD